MGLLPVTAACCNNVLEHTPSYLIIPFDNVVDGIQLFKEFAGGLLFSYHIGVRRLVCLFHFNHCPTIVFEFKHKVWIITSPASFQLIVILHVKLKSVHLRWAQKANLPEWRKMFWVSGNTFLKKSPS